MSSGTALWSFGRTLLLFPKESPFDLWSRVEFCQSHVVGFRWFQQPYFLKFRNSIPSTRYRNCSTDIFYTEAKQSFAPIAIHQKQSLSNWPQEIRRKPPNRKKTMSRNKVYQHFTLCLKWRLLWRGAFQVKKLKVTLALEAKLRAETKPTILAQIPVEPKQHSWRKPKKPNSIHEEKNL